MSTVWEILGIQQTNSKREIKKAYAKAIKDCHPEEKPEEFAQLKEAYEMALQQGEAISSHVVTGIVDSEKQTKEEESFDSKEKISDTRLLDKLEQFQEVSKRSVKAERVLQQFCHLFANDFKRQNQDSWRAFYLSEDFLDVQFEEALVQGIYEFLKQQEYVSYFELPTGFAVEMLIAYGIVLEEEGKVMIQGNGESEGLEVLGPCEKIIANMWNEQEGQWSGKRALSMMKKQENRCRQRAFWDYHTMCKWAEKGFLGEERKQDWYGILEKAKWYNLRTELGKPGMSPETERHECILSLYTHWVRNYELPYPVCEFMYQNYELVTLRGSQHEPYYQKLRQVLQEKYPELTELDRKHRMNQLYMEYGRELQNMEKKYRYYQWIEEPSPLYPKMGLAVRNPCIEIGGEQERQEVEALLADKRFLEIAFDEGFGEHLSHYKVSYYTSLKLMELYENRLGCERMYQSMKRQRQQYEQINICMCNEPYDGLEEDIRVETDPYSIPSTGKKNRYLVDMPQSLQIIKRQDVSKCTKVEKAQCILELMKDYPQDMTVTEEETCHSALEHFLQEYGFIHNNYVILKYGNQNRRCCERVMAMGIISDQEKVYDILGETNSYLVLTKDSSRNIKGETVVAAWIWTAARGIRPVMMGEQGEFYGAPNLGVRVYANLAEYLAGMYSLEHVTEIIKCRDGIRIDKNHNDLWNDY